MSFQNESKGLLKLVKALERRNERKRNEEASREASKKGKNEKLLRLLKQRFDSSVRKLL